MKELVEKAISGDERAFAELILNYQQDLYKIALTKLNTEYDIEEAIQETMISAFKNLKNLKDVDKFKKWIIKILINKCNEIYRKRILRLVPLNEIDKCTIFESDNSEIESKLNFYSIIKILDKKERTIVVLYYSEKYTTREIAEILNKNENTIKTILRRAKIKLKNKYQGIIDIF